MYQIIERQSFEFRKGTTISVTRILMCRQVKVDFISKGQVLINIKKCTAINRPYSMNTNILL